MNNYEQKLIATHDFSYPAEVSISHGIVEAQRLSTEFHSFIFWREKLNAHRWSADVVRATYKIFKH